MSKFAANLTMLFTEVPFLERFAAARDAGFEAVEFLFPYEWPAAELGRRLREQGALPGPVQHAAGQLGRGERGMAAIPGGKRSFAPTCQACVTMPWRSGCTKVHAMKRHRGPCS